jgi:hypothetical protein
LLINEWLAVSNLPPRASRLWTEYSEWFSVPQTTPPMI